MKAASGIFSAVALSVVLAFSVLSCSGGGDGGVIPPPLPGLTYGGAGDDAGASVRQTSDGGFIIAGSTTSSGAGGRDVYLIKTDTSGTLEWTGTFGEAGDDYAQSVRQTSDGGYIIAGSTDSNREGLSHGGYDVYLIKTDPLWSLEWEKFFGGPEDDYGFEAQQTSDGGYIIVGTHPGTMDTEPDAYLIKTDDSGTPTWEKTFGDSIANHWAEGHSVRQTPDGGYIITGTAESQNVGDEFDVYLVKTDSDGNKAWEKTIGGAGDQGGNSVIEASGGGYIVAGHTGASGSEDVYLIKTDSLGGLQWERTFGSNGADEGTSVEQRSDGGYVVAGSTTSAGAGGSDVYFLTTDANGNAQ